MKSKLQTILCIGSLIASPLIAILIILGGASPQQALSDAVAHRDIRSARLALLLGADINAHPGGHLPNIVNAGWHGDVDMLDFLLAHGANIESQDKFGGTALLRAAQNSQCRAIEFLLMRAANPNVKDKEGGNTALDLELRNHNRILRLMETSGAKASEH